MEGMDRGAMGAVVPARDGQDALAYGCLFGLTGDEDAVIRALVDRHPGVEAISPKRVRIRRAGGVGTEEQVTLFPGYVFFRVRAADPDFTPKVWRLPARLLTYDDGVWQLHGADAQIAQAFFEAGGVVKLSTAYYEGDRIRILDGFLKNYEGSIARVNHRARTAEIKVQFQDKTLSLWLGFELVEKKPAE